MLSTALLQGYWYIKMGSHTGPWDCRLKGTKEQELPPVHSVWDVGALFYILVKVICFTAVFYKIFLFMHHCTCILNQ